MLGCILCLSSITAGIAAAAEGDSEPLEIGVYGYLGIGVGYGDNLGAASSEYINNNFPQHKTSANPYASYNLGLIWKRKINPGWQSMFQAAYRPLSFSVSQKGINHDYSQQMLSFDFIESYAFIRGFSPYVGISLNFFELKFKETGVDGTTNEADKSSSQVGFIGGWDLAKSPNSRWRFRTDFRWYPDTSLNYKGQRVTFSNFEFQPIQVIVRF